MKDIEALLNIYPNFKLAHLIRGDLLMARAHPLSTIGSAAGASTSTGGDAADSCRASAGAGAAAGAAASGSGDPVRKNAASAAPVANRTPPMTRDFGILLRVRMVPLPVPPCTAPRPTGQKNGGTPPHLATTPHPHAMGAA